MPTARDILGPMGPLARNLPGYEAREAQLAMADAVERALAGDRKLVCEAGTGTGKTLAYLVPALLSGRKVVVSTATKALQEQIVAKDLPLLVRYAGLQTDALLIKGLSNYLCRRRYQEFRDSAEALRPAHASALATLERWVGETDSGDLAELVTLGEANPVRLAVASSSETRVGAACPHFDECFVTRLKREAERARLLVVNHHLLFADLALKGDHPGGVLPAYDTVVFDEAHQMEDIATEFFGVRVSSARVETFARDAEHALRRAGYGDRLLSAAKAGPLPEQVREAAASFFQSLAQLVPPDGGKHPLDVGAWPREVHDVYHRLDAALEAVGAFAEGHPTTEAIELIARRTPPLRADLALFLGDAKGSAARSASVPWVEVSARAISLGSSPVDVAEILKKKLFDPMPVAVLTSATLTTSGGFSFLRRRIGLAADDVPVDELLLPSPFDFARRSLLYVPRDLPEVAHATFSEAAGERIAHLVELSRGGAFVLCTSVRSMRRLHGILARRRVAPLLLQGEFPKGALLARFRSEGHSVLVATMSFWEGVDVPGDALRLVIIDKIPFPVPTDPVVAARCRALEAAGESSFPRYHLPAAAILLKQGFGRLLRTATDRGVVAILDRRLVTKGYGKLLLASLPPAPRTDSLTELGAFFRAENSLVNASGDARTFAPPSALR